MFEELLSGIPVNRILPRMQELVEGKGKADLLASILMESMCREEHPPVDVVHDGKVHTVRRVDPGSFGKYRVLSLLLLFGSYGEQCTVIDMLYPERLKVPAKAFAAWFTWREAPPAVQTDERVLELLESANAGIAYLLAKGDGVLHADAIDQKRQQMERLAEDGRKRDQYEAQMKQKEQADRKG